VEARALAAEALGVRFAAASHFTLRDVLETKDEDVTVRVAAAQALGAMCALPALDSLREFAQVAGEKHAFSSDVTIGLAAIEALGAIHPKDLADRLPALSSLRPKSVIHVAVASALRPAAAKCSAILSR
jgi:HEAT repeat protein